MKSATAIIVCCFSICLQAQEGLQVSFPDEPVIVPSVKTVLHKLGDKTIPLKVQQYGENPNIVFINLHDDETTSVEAARRILETEGGLLIEVENNRKRNIRFGLGNRYYYFDPNRIFSAEGIAKSLSELGKVSDKAIEEVSRLGERILQMIPDEVVCVIALHNNTEGFFSVSSYTEGKEKAKEASRVFINPLQDEDDFFLTTDNILYEEFVSKGFNAILQDNENCTEDGSLSVYCGKKNIRYVNCETEHGKADQYFDMIKALIQSIPLPAVAAR